MNQQTTAGRIREHILATYIDPARTRQESTVRIVAGDVHKALHLRNRVPAVCQVLSGKKFLAENNLILEKQEGPRSGQSTTAVFVYRLAGESRSFSDEIESRWQSLRGIAKEAFTAPGGGEAFLRSERENFYGPGQDPLREDWGK